MSGYSACTEFLSSATADSNNHLAGFSYDAAGNTLSDGNYSYTWNGESQMKTAAGVTYQYDGDGRRVAKTGSKLYWYGSSGAILSETDASGNTLNDYIFFGSRRVTLVPASGSALLYAEDFLGTSRTITQNNGTLCYDADFTPFGAESAYTSTCAQNYKFEGKERDTETQNDDFGARYYSWRFGRWLSSDWSAVPVPVPYANLTNPQTLNLYSMVADDPESFADLDGHEAERPDPSTGAAAICNGGAGGDYSGGVCQGPDKSDPSATPPAEQQRQSRQSTTVHHYVRFMSRQSNHITVHQEDHATTTTTDADGNVTTVETTTVTNAVYVVANGTVGFVEARQGQPGDSQERLNQNEAETALGGASRVYDEIAGEIRFDGVMRFAGKVIAGASGAGEFVEAAAGGHFAKAAFEALKHWPEDHQIDDGALGDH